MTILSTPGWEDYELLDSGYGYRLERFGKFKVSRPDPQAIWSRNLDKSTWLNVDASFDEEKEGKDKWTYKSHLPKKWPLHYKNITFFAELTPFKHTGIFPEQHLQWDWMTEKLQSRNKKAKILNLFGYTGIASLVCAAAGASVTHVDASKPAIGWARENQTASKLQDKPIRWILDDAIKFTQREARRGVQYDGIIMDPPVYGHGPHGEKWDFNESFPQLLQACKLVLSDDPLFVLINAYAVSASAIMLENVLHDFTKGLYGKVESGELALEEKNSKRLLSTGIFGRWSK